MEITYPSNLPLVKLPEEIEFTLFIIREELKSRKFSIDLEKIGFDSSIFSSDFSELIFASIGFTDNSDEFFSWYLEQVDTFCQDIDLSEGVTLTKQAFNFYVHLMMEKRGQEKNRRQV